jgi:hypothetical protein
MKSQSKETTPSCQVLATGDMVRIVFLDHVEDSDHPLEFEVFGRILKRNSTATTIGSWIFTKDDNEAGDDNIKTWCIVNSAIQTIKQLN